jgi:hypothetical protein
MAVAAWTYFWIFYSVTLVFGYVFVSVPCCFFLFYYGSVVQFEVRYCGISVIVLFAQDSFGYFECFIVPYELFWIYFPISVKNDIGDFDGHCTESAGFFLQYSHFHNTNSANP